MTDEKFKATIRLVTGEYEYIEVQVENTPQGIVETQRAFKEAIRGEVGVSDEIFDSFIQNQITGEENHIEVYNKMNSSQKKLVQCLKRAKNRVTYKSRKNEEKPYVQS